MNNIYQLKITDFEGPIDKLLELITNKKLEINKISLAEVTADFLNYVQKLKEEFEHGSNQKEYLTILADFIVIAGRLILIKSKYILNMEINEEEVGAGDLEFRLKWFSEFKPALKIINNLWNKNYFLARPYLATKVLNVDFFAPGQVDLNILTKTMEEIFSEFKDAIFEQKFFEKKLVSLEEKIQELLNYFKSISETILKSSDYHSKSELILTFLALLHLAYDKLILLEQNSHFSDIIIKKR